MVDAATKKSLSQIPLMKTNAGPRDKDAWVQVGRPSKLEIDSEKVRDIFEFLEAQRGVQGLDYLRGEQQVGRH